MGKINVNEWAEKLDCSSQDIKNLVNLMNKNHVNFYSVDMFVNQELGFDNPNINTYIYATLEKAQQKFVDQAINLANDLNLDVEILKNLDASIYANKFEYGFDSALSSYDLTDFSEENLKSFINDCYEDEDLNKSLLENQDNLNVDEKATLIRLEEIQAALYSGELSIEEEKSLLGELSELNIPEDNANQNKELDSLSNVQEEHYSINESKMNVEDTSTNEDTTKSKKVNRAKQRHKNSAKYR